MPSKETGILIVFVLFIWTFNTSIPSNGQIVDSEDVDLDLTPELILTKKGTITKTVPGNTEVSIPITTLIHRADYYIIGELNFRTNYSSLFGNTGYKLQTEYSMYGFDSAVISSDDRVEVFNNSRSRNIKQIDTNRENEENLYLSINLLPGFNKLSEVNIEYKFKVIKPVGDLILDRTKSYNAILGTYPDVITSEQTDFIKEIGNIYLPVANTMRARNETGLPNNYEYFYDVQVKARIENLGSSKAGTDVEFKIDNEISENHQVEKSGVFIFTLKEVTFEQFHELIIRHSGEDVWISLRQVVIHIPALIEVKDKLIAPQWFNISATVVALLIGLLSYKIVSYFGAMKIKRYKESELL